MTGPQCPDEILTKLQRVAIRSKRNPERAWTTLAHHIDVAMLEYSYRSIRRTGALGVDGVSWSSYGANLEANLARLHKGFKEGTYRASPCRRVYIQKKDGSARPLGIPTVEDKVLQHSVGMVLNAVYEQDFLDCSYGFRPKRSAHDALESLRGTVMSTWGGWVIDLDVASFFDTMNHGDLRSFLDLRIRDGVLRRMLDKWLTAGVVEDGVHRRSRVGCPQGGVISPLLANIYLHHVLDTWFYDEARVSCTGQSELVRYADDAVMVFERQADAEHMMSLLADRFGLFGLRLHPTKTRMLAFRQPRREGPRDGIEPESFDFLGLTHYWGRSRRGFYVVQRKTSKKSLRRSIGDIWGWCRLHRHLPIRIQHRMLRMKLLGHYRYFGVVGNSRALARFWYRVRRAWQFWLNRRSCRGSMTWEKYGRMLLRYPLPNPRIYQRL